MLEYERYELREGPAYRFDLERRAFFKLLGGGLLLFLVFDPASEAQESGRAQGMRGDARPPELAAWLHIAEDGTVTVYTGKAEMGQNIRTSLTQAVAQELDAPLSSIQLVMGDTQLTPYDMGTFGSRTTPTMAPQLRKVGAAAREMLIDLAAEKWKTDRANVSVAEGKVKNKSTGEAAGFGDLTKGRQISRTVNGAVVTPAEQWTIAGSSQPKINARDIVTGAHRYTSDMNRPGLLHGRVLRPPVVNAKLTSLDTSKVDQAKGATIVHEGDFVGAAAADEATAAQAVFALGSKWNFPTQPSNKEISDYLRNHTTHSRGPGSAPEQGSIDEGLAAAAHKLDATYTVAYIAHTPLEPRAAVAEWNDDKLTVWTGTQRPFGVQSELAEAFGIPESRIRVIVPDTGSAYGGKHTGECAIEAARLAKAAGKPVKLVWTREEEFTFAYFRPAGVIEVRSGVSNGRIVAWEFHNYNSGASGLNTMYDIPNKREEFHPTQYPLRQGSYRGLAATANHFARESHMDELAALSQSEPLEFRLRNLKDERFRAVLQAAADRFGWGKRKAGAGIGYGIAGGFEKGSYVATCAEVHCESGQAPRIVRVVEAFECGAILNPDMLKNQVEGAVVQGLGGALFEAVEFENGRILDARFSKYRVPRFRDVPKIEVVLIDRKDLAPAGAGETPIMTLAPAVANAIYSVTGERIRSMPLSRRAPAGSTVSGAPAI